MRITRGNRAALLIYSILFFCLILYNEFFEYARMRRSWKLSPGELGMTLEHPDNVKILFVGDPQIQGIINEPPSLIGMLSRWDSDTYLRRTFQLAIHFFEPDIVVFLGDLVDEGSIATKQQYSSYQKRFFDNIFVIPKYLNVKMVLLAGDNDIGGEGSDKMTYELARRFEENFDSLSEVVPYKNVDVLKFNLVPWMRPTDLVDEEIFRKELDEDIEDLILKSDNKFRVLITHNSLGGVKESRRAELLYRLKPHFVFTAHSHRVSIQLV
uniref:Uncharacterized protein C630.12-like n=1 Tax=Saccoglossus kowalevskii TaxID=10224 RepID=A0ABM0M9Y2_SACKO|nr:PREDICTED: uncharacterized protein C630.12-like [Saccoglossus kowalevskii]